MVTTVNSPETPAAEPDPKAVADHARRLLAANPHNADAHRLLGAALRRLGEDEAANRSELAAIEASGRDPELIAAGRALIADDHAAAEAILRSVLARRPDDVAALRMLAEVADHGGHLRSAEQLLRRALELAPGFGFARATLAMVLHRQNRSGEALAELDAAGPEMGEHDDYRSLRAAALSRIGEHEKAITIYEDLLTREPAKSDIWLSVAHLQKTVGRQDDAVASYRRVLDIDPNRGEAWFSLANLKTIRFGDDDVRVMEETVAAGGPSDDDRLHLHFALGKAFEDRREDDAAFRHYEAGNALRAGQLVHDPKQVTEFVEAAENLFTPEFFAARAAFGAQDCDPIFIVGMPRAGSTLVEQILSSHPQIEGTGELPDIIILARSLEKEGAGEGKRAWHDYPYILADLDEGAVRRLGELYLERTRIQRKTSRPSFIDKMPNNWLHTGFIRLILPKARIVDVRRHPLACGFSNFKQHFARGQEFTYDLAHFGLYYRDYARMMAHFDRVQPGAIHRVEYERLVADPEAEVRHLLDYLGLPFDPACLDFHKTERAVRTASSEQVKQPINDSAVEQWRRFEPWLGPMKEALGPELAD